jgi:ribosomal protein L32
VKKKDMRRKRRRRGLLSLVVEVDSGKMKLRLILDE